MPPRTRTRSSTMVTPPSGAAEILRVPRRYGNGPGEVDFATFSCQVPSHGVGGSAATCAKPTVVISHEDTKTRRKKQHICCLFVSSRLRGYLEAGRFAGAADF